MRFRPELHPGPHWGSLEALSNPYSWIRDRFRQVETEKGMAAAGRI